MNIAFGVRWDDIGRRWPMPLMMASLLLAAGFLPTAGEPPVAARAASSLVSVIVREDPGAGDAPERTVESLGGYVGSDLDIINSFTAKVPADRVDELQGAPGVYSVSPDARVKLQTRQAGRTAMEFPAGSMANVIDSTGAAAYWMRGYFGQGVDIAMIDSGVAPVEGLRTPGKLLNGPDLSFESQSALPSGYDTYGHGTHIAGIIAGRDRYYGPGATNFVGMAPGARLISLKVADALGTTDVSQVIAAIDWVVHNRRSHGLNIRVLNLSFGTDGTQPYTIDPLAYAAEVAWHKGIVVVVSAGNGGYGSRKLNNPAYDPFVLAVGASDTNGTGTQEDDTVPSWSSSGNGQRNPDLVAPGKSIISLRAPMSSTDVMHPEGRMPNPRLFKGSGTSQSAAVVSGAVALILQQRPRLTPDEVKSLLVRTATPLPSGDPTAQGAGELNLRAAFSAPTVAYTQPWEQSTGTGSLEAARGSGHVTDGSAELVGEQDIFGAPWNGSAWAPGLMHEINWDGGNWNGHAWSGHAWSGQSWNSVKWDGHAWSGHAWSGQAWSSTGWAGQAWSTAGWGDL